MLLDDYSEIHARMDSTVQLECTCRTERTNLLIIITGKLNVNLRRTRFFTSFGCAVLPGAIGDDMPNWDIVNDIDFFAFLNGDRGWGKDELLHMNGIGFIACIRIASRASGEEDCNGAKKEQDCNKLFHSELSSRIHRIGGQSALREYVLLPVRVINVGFSLRFVPSCLTNE